MTEDLLSSFYWQVRWRGLMHSNLSWRWNEGANQKRIEQLQLKLISQPDITPEIRAAVIAWGNIYGRSIIDVRSIEGIRALSDTSGWTNHWWRDEGRYQLVTVLLNDLINSQFNYTKKQFDSWPLTSILYIVGGANLLIIDRIGLGDGPMFPPYIVGPLYSAIMPLFKDLVEDYPNESKQKVYLFDIGVYLDFLDSFSYIQISKFGTISELNCDNLDAYNLIYFNYYTNLYKSYALRNYGFLRNYKMSESYNSYFDNKKCKE